MSSINSVAFMASQMKLGEILRADAGIWRAKIERKPRIFKWPWRRLLVRAANRMARAESTARYKTPFMPTSITYPVTPIGVIQSDLKSRDEAPLQGPEGAPDAWLEVSSGFAEGLVGIAVGEELIVITWLHEAERKTLKVHPRREVNGPLYGVFATRSPDRPNPLGLHHVVVREINGPRLRIGPIEAIDGTPVVDIKPVIVDSQATG
jgi:tRNA-Thr(GGU) m(6)t(6)A37 methyltransferase TsaA